MQNESYYHFFFLLFIDYSTITMLSSITLVSISSSNASSTFIMMWPSANVQTITNYHVGISSAQYGHIETNTTLLSTARIDLNYSIFYNISISQSACAVKNHSVFTLGNIYIYIYIL